MIRRIGFLALLNAALWLGGSVFLTFVVGPHFFSPAVVDLVGRKDAGMIAQTLLAKYFVLQLVFGSLAVLLLALRERTWRCRHLLGMMVVLGLILFGGFWLQPKLVGLNRDRYATTTPPEEAERLRKEFGRWHGVSQAGNLLVLVGSLAHFVLLARRQGRPDPFA